MKFTEVRQNLLDPIRYKGLVEALFVQFFIQKTGQIEIYSVEFIS